MYRLPFAMELGVFIPSPKKGKTMCMYTRLVAGNTCNTQLQGLACYKSCNDFILCFMMLSLFWATYQSFGEPGSTQNRKLSR